jgi:hypothetical protein
MPFGEQKMNKGSSRKKREKLFKKTKAERKGKRQSLKYISKGKNTVKRTPW